VILCGKYKTDRIIFTSIRAEVSINSRTQLDHCYLISSVLNPKDSQATAVLLNNKSLIKRKIEFSLTTMLTHPSKQRE